MSDETNDFKFNLFVKNQSGAIITYIGYAFILLAFFNYIFDFRNDYLMCVSFAAFFFIMADFIGLSKKVNLLVKIFYPLCLFLAVLSFTVMPIVIPEYNIEVKSIMLNISESLSIASLGIVLVIINHKMLSAEEAFFQEIKKIEEQRSVLIKDFETISREAVSDLKDANKLTGESHETLKETNQLNKEIHQLNKEIMEKINSAESIEDLRSFIHEGK